MCGRVSKIILLWCLALFTSLVALNNVIDYDSNFQFVLHVLSMDSLFSAQTNRWRAIENPAFHHLAYLLIIGTEITVALLCWLGGIKLLKNIQCANSFNRNKSLAISGLTLGIVLWIGGFLSVGGEWFLMWQSQSWNGVQASSRLGGIFIAILIYISLPDKD